MDEDWVSESEPEEDAGPASALDYRECLWIDGRRVLPYDCPDCLQSDIFDCELCDFFAPWECRLLHHPSLMDEVRTILSIYRERQAARVKRRRVLIRVIHSELQTHGRPLHYTVLARIVADRHPELGVSEGGVLRLVASHPHVFERVVEGVYRSR